MIANRSIGAVAVGIAAGLMSAARAPAQDRGAAPPPPAEAEAGHWGTLRGRVVFGAEPPAPEVLVDLDRETRQTVRDFDVVSQRLAPVFSECLIVDRETRGVRGAIVYLVKPTAVRDAARAARPKSVDFRADRGAFTPHVLALMQGTEVVVGTADPIYYGLRGRMPGAEFVLTMEGGHITEFMTPHTYRNTFNYTFGMLHGRGVR
ncbi:MAG TPA: hypothetical protein VG406_12915 [Isosphaeraceae bacterium]|jgi:hypothetical protein|nr:hypothetical protein [Isosphaeraceae bacterium]